MSDFKEYLGEGKANDIAFIKLKMENPDKWPLDKVVDAFAQATKTATSSFAVADQVTLHTNNKFSKAMAEIDKEVKKVVKKVLSKYK